MKDKKFLRPTIIGFCLLLLSMLLVGIFGITDAMNGGSGQIYLDGVEVNYGLKASIGYYFQLWRPSAVPHEVGYIGLVLVLVAIFTTVTLIVMSIVKKKPIYIIPALLLGAAIAFLPFIFLLVVPMVQLAALRGIAMLFMAGATGLNLFAIYFLILACGDMLKDSLAVLNKAAGEQPKEEQQAQAAAVEGLTEEQVREIVEKYLAEHVEEKHNQEEAPAPVVEEADEAGINFMYKFSFSARLIRAGAERQDFYNEIKNEYLSYKKVNSKISWGHELFKLGRNKLGQMKVKGKTLCVYLPLDPTKYDQERLWFKETGDEEFPMMMQVKSDRAAKYVAELIADVMLNNNIVLNEKYEEQNYKLPEMSIEKMLKEGLAKENNSTVSFGK